MNKTKGNTLENDPQQGHVHGPHCNHGHHHEKQEPIVNQGPKIGRNDPCPCGSEKKYKKCCGKNS